MDLRVERLEAVSDGDAAAISGLVAQMSSSGAAVPIERISRVATAPGSCILVARTADAVVGTATLLSIDTLVGQFGFVEEVVVDASMRGRGIGRRLMMGVLAAARERGPTSSN